MAADARAVAVAPLHSYSKVHGSSSQKQQQQQQQRQPPARLKQPPPRGLTAPPSNSVRHGGRSGKPKNQNEKWRCTVERRCGHAQSESESELQRRWIGLKARMSARNTGGSERIWRHAWFVQNHAWAAILRVRAAPAQVAAIRAAVRAAVRWRFVALLGVRSAPTPVAQAESTTSAALRHEVAMILRISNLGKNGVGSTVP